MGTEPSASITMHNGLAVYRFGTGEPILFMPGPHRFQRPGLRSADALIQGLTSLDRTVTTFDPPGSGRSTRPAHLSMDEMLACTDEALDTSGLHRPVDAIGHSMGGFTLIAYALRRPQRIARLVLVGTGAGGYMQARGALWNRRHPDFAGMAALGILQTAIPTRGPERLLRNYIERRSFVDPSQARPTPVHLTDWLQPRSGHTEWHRIAVRLDYRPRLRDIVAPSLILCGRFDPQFALPCSEQLAHVLPHARLQVFERSGHYPFLEEPERFWSTVQAFLAPTAAAAPPDSASPAGGTS
ncbi:MAG: alpha/beta hydrolase [Deinococcales bacterium]